MPLNGIPPVAALQNETVWFDAGRYQDAERRYHEISAPENLNATRPQLSLNQKANNSSTGSQLVEGSTSIAAPSSSLASEIAQARQKIQNFLKSGDYESDFNKNILKRLQVLEEEKEKMGQRLNEMHNMINTVMKQIAGLDLTAISKTKVDQHKKQDKPSVNGPSAAASNSDDDVDLFGSDEETEEDVKLKQERVKAYENKKAKKPALVAKSSVVLDVKPWSDETDMKELEMGVRKIQLDGLNWGASKLVPLAYGIKKLQIIAIVEDEKVSIDGLQESIEELDDLVQSVDIAAFNKL